MRLALESQLDTVMDEPFASQAIANTGCDEQIDGALLEHAGTHALFDVLTAAPLDDNRLDAFEVEQVRQHQSRRAGADNPDLCPHSAISYTRSRMVATPWPTPTHIVHRAYRSRVRAS